MMVQDDMDMDFAQLYEASARTSGDQSFSPGERVKGKVVLITADTVFIDYGAKSEGWADVEEFLDDKGEKTIKIGSEVELAFIGYGPSGAHLGSCLRKESGGAGKELLRKAFESGLTVEGTVTGTNKGGLEVTISGTKVFCPFSQMDLTYCDRPEQFVGTTQKFKVVQFEEEGRNIVLSRRAVLQEEREALAAETRKGLTVGAILSGRVTRLTPFGAFVDLGGIEGLIHISEISRNPVKNPADFLSKDQEVTVQVLNLEIDEKGIERISLSMKALEPDPWETGLPFLDGDLVKGVVRNLTPYGAFVSVGPGLEGLVHISEIAHKHIRHPREMLKEDQEIVVKVLEINKEQRRISLSIKEAPSISDLETDALTLETIRTGDVIRRRVKEDQVSPMEGSEGGSIPSGPQTRGHQTPQVGLLVKGVVRSIKPYGFFVDLPELGPHQRGLLHKSQLEVSETGRSPKGLKEGDEIQVEIIKIDDQGRISLSRQSVLDNQDRAEFNEYQDQVKETGKLGTMADLFRKKKKSGA